MGERKRGEFLIKTGKLSWMPLSVFIFLSISIAFFGYFFYQKQKKDAFHEQAMQLQAIADLKALEIKNWLGERISDARMISQNQDRTALLSAFLRDRSSDLRREAIRRWMTVFQDIYHYENVLLLDRQGNVVLAAHPHHALVDSEGRKAMDTARRRRDAVLSDLHSDPQVPHIHMGMVSPLMAGNDVLGFVLLRIDPAQFLYPMVQTWPTPSPSAETLLVRREGDTVLFLNELRHRQGTAMTLRLPIGSPELPAALAASGRTGDFPGRDYRGVAVWSAVRPVPHTSWSIIAKIDRDEIERPLRRSALAVLMVASSLILMVALMILFLWHRQNTHYRLHLLELRQESEEKFKHVFETANVGKSITQLNGEIDVNQAFCDMLGYSREELQKTKWQDLTPVDEIEATQKMLAPLLQGRQNTARFNKRYIRKDGSIVWGDVSVAIKRDPAGKPLHFITTVVDITERKRAEDALRRNEKDLRESQRIAHVGSWRLNVADNQVVWTEELYNMYGFDPSIPPPPYTEHMKLFTPESWERLSTALTRTRETGIPYTLELETIKKDGNNGWMWVRGEVEVDSAGKTVGLWGVAQDITERKQAEGTLRKIIDNAPFGAHLYELQPEERLVFVGANRAADSILGVNNGQFVGKTIEEAFPPLIQTDIPDAYRRAAASGERYDTEQIEFAEGGIRGAFEVHAFQTSPNRMATFFFDITERKRAEAKLQREQALYMDLVNALPAGMYRFRILPAVKWDDANWRTQMESQYIIDFVSDRFCEICGIDRGEFTANPGIIPDRIHPDDSVDFIHKNAAAILSMSTFSWEGRMIVPQKGTIWIRFESIPRPLENGEIIWTGIINDISERKRAEEELRTLSTRNQAMLEAIPDIIMEVDKDKVYTWANHAGLEFFGADVIGHEAAFYFEGEQQTYLAVKPIFNGQEDVLYVESWQRRYNGEKRLLAWWCRVLKDEIGNVVGALSSARDITEVRLAEDEIRHLNEELEQRVVQRTAQLEVANKELEAFSYSVSHDLRAPLRAIDGFVRIVLEEYAPKLDEEGRRLLGVITGNTKKMGQLIDDLLAFSRLSRQQMASALVDMASLADDAFSELKSIEKDRRIEFKVGEIPTAFGDRSMLRHVLLNLISNALKFTRPRAKARIEFGAQAATGETIWYVKDNGVGFDMAYVDKLFGVFQRLHGADEFEGTGVGLAIVQRIIARHGGRVWAESGKSGGATFYFTLPAGSGPGADAPPTEKAAE